MADVASMRLTMLIALTAALTGWAEDHRVRLQAPRDFLPPVKAFVFVKAGAPGPGAPKHEAVASTASLADEVSLPHAGPFDLWIVPKDGRPIRAVAAWKADSGSSEISLAAYVGILQFRGDGQPRGTLLVTPFQDEGPEAKDHRVIQTAGDTRGEMIVPPGDYAVWVVPDSGARARRVVDKVRVFAGKVVAAD
ncbi:MAG: hypothetical protein NZ700_05140 [Gemmataceae bacterium]|nr:hypothetical protein [Gemmataceae bacterium]